MDVHGSGPRKFDGGNGDSRRVGVLYDERMCKHHTPDGDYHPENPNRIRAIWNKLQSSGILQRCVVLNGKEAEDKHILAVHSKNHVDLIKNISSKEFDSRRDKIAAQLNSIYFNKGSSEAAYLAAGSVIDVAERVAQGDLDSGIAIVRPPGHHAEHDEAMGFCLFNNIAVAASFILNERPDLGIKKILIVDWDVHHGNATQKMFWRDPRVLFFSVHRHEFGSFYPATDDGYYTMVGEGPGAGYNINVPWENGQCRDADYLAVWDHILLPVAKEYNPDMIIVSAGFDAAVGDPLGGCCVTPYGYSIMLEKLMNLGQGKIVLALEGGYNLDSIATSTLACAELLVDGRTMNNSSETCPFESTWRVIQAVRRELSPFWPMLSDELPDNLTSKKVPVPEVLLSSSDSEDEASDSRLKSLEEILQGITLSRVEVKEDSQGQAINVTIPWRLELSKTDIWYASFGSNMWRPRFLCYIEGGQVEGMKKPCTGSMDKTPPKEMLWKIFPHRLFFGHEYTNIWGQGGAAFLHPESNSDEKSFLCLYRITLEQFNDVLYQENSGSGFLSDNPLLDIANLNKLTGNASTSIEISTGQGWYHNLVYLGKEQELPIVTMTCSHLDMEDFKSGKVPLCAPAKGYVDTLVKGLAEGPLSKEEALVYIQKAVTKPL
ncbi:histone deacetylase 5 [Cucurbita pepo subsp. pepo]|uniref:histone deacetylase 5 n=1 Tax=Cucurbita pepo subsp. pepo TaxID=3664 RepID=UPI000C9D6DDF|nr:histone deacetylase 5 [Cucurbita pepo subsp. pepo]